MKFLHLTTYLSLALLALMVRCALEQPQATASLKPGLLPTPAPATTHPSLPSPQVDLFQDASDKATGAATITQSAQSKYDWDAVAQLLREAIALMKAVPKSSPHYVLAQKKVIEYQRHLGQAKQLSGEAAPRPAPVTQKHSRPTIPIAQPVPQEQLVSIVSKTTIPKPTSISPAVRQSVKQVVGQFFATDAHLEVGMRYGEYSDRVTDLKGAIAQLDRSGATDLPAYTSLRSALTNYETALDTWDLCIKKHSCANDLVISTSSLESSSPLKFSSETSFQGQVNTAIPAIWVAAREHIESAQGQL